MIARVRFLVWAPHFTSAYGGRRRGEEVPFCSLLYNDMRLAQNIEKIEELVQSWKMFGASPMCGPLSFGASRYVGHRVWEIEMSFILLYSLCPIHRLAPKLSGPQIELAPDFVPAFRTSSAIFYSWSHSLELDAYISNKALFLAFKTLINL